MKKPLLLSLFVLPSLFTLAGGQYKAFDAGIEVGVSATTIQKYYKSYGLFKDPYFEKDYNGTAGIFVNRFLSPKTKMELGFYLTSKGTWYISESLDYNSIWFSRERLYYLEIPILMYYYPSSHKQFSYRYGVSIGHLLNNQSFYKDYDIALSLGIRFKPIKTGFFKNDLCILKVDGSLLPISMPQEVQEANAHHSHLYQMNEIQRNLGITLSFQHYLSKNQR